MIAGCEGGCACGQVRYRLKAEPIMVNCCHCRDCQRQTGGAFVINAVIEPHNVELLGQAPAPWRVESGSGKGQSILRCPACKVAVWSIYHAAGDGAWFLRAATLDEPDRVRPQVHIFTADKLPWLALADDIPQRPAFYSGRDLIGLFGEDSAARWRTVIGR